MNSTLERTKTQEQVKVEPTPKPPTPTEKKSGGRTIARVVLSLAVVIALLFAWRLSVRFAGLSVTTQFLSYVIVLVAMTAGLEIILTPFSRKLSKVQSEGDKQFLFYHALRTIIGAIFYSVYSSAADAVVTQCFGWALKPHYYGFELQLPKPISLILAIAGMAWFMRNSIMPFVKSHSCKAKNWWMIGEAALHLAVSAVLVNLLSVNTAAIVIAALDIVVLTILDSFILYRKEFRKAPVKYLVKNYIYLAIFAGVSVLAYNWVFSFGNQYKEILINGVIGVLFSLIQCILIIIADKNFRTQWRFFRR